MAKIVFVGTKEEGMEDHLYGSGVTWTHPGDVQEVSDPAIVAKMIEHTDTWALAKGEKLGDALPVESDDAVRARKHAERIKQEVDEDQEERDAQVFGLQKMGKDALIAHAKRTFGVTLSPKSTVQDMRTELTRLTNRGIGAKPTPRSAKKR